MQLQNDHRRGHLRAGVPGGDKAIGLAFGLQAQPNDHRAVGFTAHGHAGLVGHVDDFRCLDDLDAIASHTPRLTSKFTGEEVTELTFNDARLTDELNRVRRFELSQRLERPGDRCPRGKVATHGVQGDPSQG